MLLWRVSNLPFVAQVLLQIFKISKKKKILFYQKSYLMMELSFPEA